MTSRTAARVAWSAWALMAGVALLLRSRSGGGFLGAWAPTLTLGAFMTVGAVVASRQPRNAVGWLCCTAGLLGGLTGLTSEYARYALLGREHWLPGGLAAAWVNSWLGVFWTGLVLTFLLLLFPTGRLPSRRWRTVAWACPVVLSAGCLVIAVSPGTMQVPGEPRNPLGIESAAAILRPVRALMLAGVILVALLCAVSAVVRFLRARGVEREQLKLSLGQLFGRIGAQTSSWAVASATLAVAALFQPARRRVQEGVDRRFNRRRYDAARTIEGFSVRLRQQTDLDTLAAELLQVVHRTVEPTTASLWLRPSTRRPGGG